LIFDQLVCAEVRGSLKRKHFVTDGMQPDNSWHLLCIVEMTLHSIFNHLTQIGKGVCFGRNSMTESGSNKASIDRILGDFKDDFHGSTIS